MSEAIRIVEMASKPDEDETYILEVLKVGKAFTHRIPGWPVLSVDLRLFEFKYGRGVYHGFIKDDVRVSTTPRPFLFSLSNTLDNCFVMENVSL